VDAAKFCQYTQNLDRQARRAASLAQAQACIEQHKSRLRDMEISGLMRTLARMVRRARTKPGDGSC
jgi:hypothetical protein